MLSLKSSPFLVCLLTLTELILPYSLDFSPLLAYVTVLPWFFILLPMSPLVAPHTPFFPSLLLSFKVLPLVPCSHDILFHIYLLCLQAEILWAWFPYPLLNSCPLYNLTSCIFCMSCCHSQTQSFQNETYLSPDCCYLSSFPSTTVSSHACLQISTLFLLLSPLFSLSMSPITSLISPKSGNFIAIHISVFFSFWDTESNL